jgi:hypothetical protein
MTLVRQLSGAGWDRLPSACRAFHQDHGEFAGQIDIVLTTNPILRACLRLAGIPSAQTGAPLVLTTSQNGGIEMWHRQIGQQTLVSKRWITKNNLLAETMGPATVLSRIEAGSDGIQQVATSWRFLGIPMPRAFMPVIRARDFMSDGVYCFDIQVLLPWIKLVLFSYYGSLAPPRSPGQ